jgi:hypothetical protein
MDEVGAVAINEIGEARGAANAGEGDDLFVIELAFLEDFVIAGEDGKVAAARTPGGVIGGDGFLGELLANERGRGGVDGSGVGDFFGGHGERINLEARNPGRGEDESGK